MGQFYLSIALGVVVHLFAANGAYANREHIPDPSQDPLKYRPKRPVIDFSKKRKPEPKVEESNNPLTRAGLVDLGDVAKPGTQLYKILDADKFIKHGLRESSQKKPILVMYSSIPCIYCDKLLPKLEELYGKYMDKVDFKIIYYQPFDHIKEKLQKHAPTLPIYYQVPEKGDEEKYESSVATKMDVELQFPNVKIYTTGDAEKNSVLGEISAALKEHAEKENKK